MPIKWKDLRDWLQELERIGQLKIMRGVPLDEVGAITEVNSKNQGPVLLFDEIPGYKKGFRLLTSIMVNPAQMAVALGLDPHIGLRELLEWFRGKHNKWIEESKKFEPVYVEKAPILENVISPPDIDLTIFPAPKWHYLDGGPYIGTADAVITRDLDEGWVNVGTYRSQLFSKDEVGLWINPMHHGAIQMKKYFAKGEKFPVVICYGIDPLLFLVAQWDIPWGVSELNYAGAIRGEPIEVVKGIDTGLPIPANAEIAIEGYIDPNAPPREEGPFGEYTGTYAGGKAPEPVVKVTRLYYRNDPILTGAPPAKGRWGSYSFLDAVRKSTLVRDTLDRIGVPGIQVVWVPEFAAKGIAIIQIKQLYDGHAAQVGILASQLPELAGVITKYIIVVDEDINPFDIEDVLWAIATRTNPAEDIIILKDTPSNRLEPAIVKRPPEKWTISRAVIKAVKPFHLIKEFPPTAIEPEEKRRKVFEKYGKDLKWTSY
jgi:UbiD family decarboxylase